MKNRFMYALIVVGLVFAGQVSFAQNNAVIPESLSLTETTPEVIDLNNQYEAALRQLIQLLKQQVSELLTQRGLSPVASITLPAGELCTFRYDASNSSVTSVQKELTTQGYTLAKIDGKAGPATGAVVTRFQKDNNLQVDGKIGNQVRAALMEKSVVCEGELGVIKSTAEGLPMTTNSNDICKINYAGGTTVIDVQTELKKRGYVIEKLDDKLGPNTESALRAFQLKSNISQTGIIDQSTIIALIRTSVSCIDVIPKSLVEITPETMPVVIESPTDPNKTSSVDTSIVEEIVTTEPVETSEVIVEPEIITYDNVNFIENDSMSSQVRSTTESTPDDTAVITYQVMLHNDEPIYIATIPESAFSVTIFDQSGRVVNTSNFDSIVASGERVNGRDGVDYFKLLKGSSVSMRTTVQPGRGIFYGELSRLSYTTNDVTKVSVPAMVSYGFDANHWRSEKVNLQN